MKGKALVLSELRKVEIIEEEVRPPEGGEVLVAVRACGICAGDVYTFSHGLDRSRYPHRIGHEGVGIVHEVGPDSRGLRPGDAVALLGGAPHFSEYVTVPGDRAFALPGGARELHHWLVEPVACIVNTLQQANVKAGDAVAVIGTGFMGLLLLQGLRFTLAGKVYAADIDRSRLSLAQEFGPLELFDLSTPSGKENILALSERGAQGVDIVFEVSGAADALDVATNLVRKSGTLVIVGWHHEPRTLDVCRWHVGGYRVLNTSPTCEPNFGAVFGRTISLMERGVFDLTRLLTHTMPVAQAQRLFELATARADGYVKGAITFPS